MIVSLIVAIALAAAAADEGAAAALAEAAAPAEAATPAAEAEPATAAKPVDRDQEVICKKEAKTASRTPSKKICQTRAQWRAEETRGGVQTRTRN